MTKQSQINKQIRADVFPWLAVFYSDEVEHEVLPVSPDAGQERLALSFWYLKPTTFDPSVMMRS